MINSGTDISTSFAFAPEGLQRTGTMGLDDALIEPLSADQAERAGDLIRRNLLIYEEAGSVLAATFRRLANLKWIYSAPGSRFFMARDMSRDGLFIGGAGVGSLHGLPLSEGLGEVRDLVVEEDYRGRGIGARLLKRCIDEAVNFGYRRLYLETTPQMEHAQKLFIRFGFRPVTQAVDQAKVNIDKLPSYYILDQLDKTKGL